MANAPDELHTHTLHTHFSHTHTRLKGSVRTMWKTCKVKRADRERLMAPPLRSSVICFNANKTTCEALKSGFKRDPCEVGGSIFHFMKMEDITFLLQKKKEKKCMSRGCKRNQMMDCSMRP